ncbi:MAG TPA: Tim44 domain-containing protein [Nitrospirae bacterium]|nr:Tim44 domain-containing protein [Nitrospirota bacterium]
MKKIFFVLFVLVSFSIFTFNDAYARAGGGKSGGMGSRGSKTYSAPSKPSQSSPSSPSQVNRQQQPVTANPATAPQPSRWGGFMGMLAGGILGGLIGNMLFSSFAHGGMGSGGYSGPGLFDIILIGIVIFFVYKFFIKRKRQQEATVYSSGNYQYSGQGPQGQIPSYDTTAQPVYVSPSTNVDLQTGISHIRQLDVSFNENSFKESATDIFFKVQAAWMARNMSNVRELLTSEMYQLMSDEVQKLKQQGRINRLENIGIRNIEITEAWQEEGKDFITIEITANVLDYVTDEANRLIEGSNTEPVKFIEYWTFTRNAGPNRWQLSAIQQG